MYNTKEYHDEIKLLSSHFDALHPSVCMRSLDNVSELYLKKKKRKEKEEICSLMNCNKKISWMLPIIINIEHRGILIIHVSLFYFFLFCTSNTVKS